jgi:hypothetical protein
MKYILYTISIIISLYTTSQSNAEQSYNLLIKNSSNYKFIITPLAGRCMHNWNVPYPYAEVLENQSILLPISDKNSGLACVNNTKNTFWKIYSGPFDPNKQSYIKLGFEHGKDSNGWWTSITEYALSIEGAKCQVSGDNGADKLVDCLNKKVYGVGEAGLLIAEF